MTSSTRKVVSPAKSWGRLRRTVNVAHSLQKQSPLRLRLLFGWGMELDLEMKHAYIQRDLISMLELHPSKVLSEYGQRSTSMGRGVQARKKFKC
jgi:hypothetical protein